jgi:sulfoacetaldehyde dehydrogenase
LVDSLYEYQGKGHSVGIHSGGPQELLRLGLELPVCRVIADQVHCVATGGAFDNGLPFSLSMGCGTWGGNGFSDNLNYRHFLNITRIVRPIAPREPAVADVLGAYWSAYGR